jgi:hypothetical protein
MLLLVLIATAVAALLSTTNLLDDLTDRIPLKTAHEKTRERRRLC